MKDKDTKQVHRSFAPEDILDPLVLAFELHKSEHPLVRMLHTRFSEAGRAALETLRAGNPDHGALAERLASELSHIAASGDSLYDPALLNGIDLRKSTKRLIEKNPQGAELERLNCHLIQDVFPNELNHESCELVEVQKAKGIEFRIYKEIRKLKTKWSESFRITFQSSAGPGSAMAKNLEAARGDLGRLADLVLAGKAIVTRKGSKERDELAGHYQEIAGEVAKLGHREAKGILGWIRDAVRAQLKLGSRPLLEFVIYAVQLLTQPVTRTRLEVCCLKYREFYLGRRDVDKKTRRRQVTVVERFCSDIPFWVQQRHLRHNPPPGGSGQPSAPTNLSVDEIEPNDIQAWLDSLKVDWRSRRTILDTIRAFFVYSRDALHALPPAMKTAAHLVPRPKPDSDAEPVPAPVLSFTNVWRLLINLQDLETLWFFALAVFAGLHQTEICRLVWEQDIVWKNGWPVQVFIASGKGKDKHGNRLGVHVDIRRPLRFILKLGEGRTGKIVTRKYLRAEKLRHLAHSLNIEWTESIMRHTFASNLFGLGYSFEKVARQTRNSVAVLKRHYYAPISKPDAQRFFSLPIPIERLASLPVQRRYWNWKSLNKFQVEPDGTACILLDAITVTTTPNGKSRRPFARILWPDDLALQVLIWDKPRRVIERELGCGRSALHHRVRKRGLIPPAPDYFTRLRRNLPVEIPPGVLDARQALAARKSQAETDTTITVPLNHKAA